MPADYAGKKGTRRTTAHLPTCLLLQRSSVPVRMRKMLMMLMMMIVYKVLLL